MDKESYNNKKYVEPTICHEWGHVLASYFLYGTLKNIVSIDFEDIPAGVFGHTKMLDFYVGLDNGLPSIYLIDKEKEKDIMILLSGVIATKICGYNKGRFHSYDTDIVKIGELTKDKKLISKLRNKTEEMLLPLKDTLQALTRCALEDYPKSRDIDNEKYYQIPSETIIEWVCAYLPESMHPPKVYSTKQS